MDINDYLCIHGYEFCYIFQNLKRRMLYFTKQNKTKTGIRHYDHFIVSLIQLLLCLCLTVSASHSLPCPLWLSTNLLNRNRITNQLHLNNYEFI